MSNNDLNFYPFSSSSISISGWWIKLIIQLAKIQIRNLWLVCWIYMDLRVSRLTGAWLVCLFVWIVRNVFFSKNNIKISLAYHQAVNYFISFSYLVTSLYFSPLDRGVIAQLSYASLKANSQPFIYYDYNLVYAFWCLVHEFWVSSMHLIASLCRCHLKRSVKFIKYCHIGFNFSVIELDGLAILRPHSIGWNCPYNLKRGSRHWTSCWVKDFSFVFFLILYYSLNCSISFYFWNWLVMYLAL